MMMMMIDVEDEDDCDRVVDDYKIKFYCVFCLVGRF